MSFTIHKVHKEIEKLVENIYIPCSFGVCGAFINSGLTCKWGFTSCVHCQLAETIPTTNSLIGSITAFVRSLASRIAFSACVAGECGNSHDLQLIGWPLIRRVGLAANTDYQGRSLGNMSGQTMRHKYAKYCPHLGVCCQRI